ncbi:nucleoporin ndc1 [Plakobranchus ocellatus]|uniref:Nucleoporin ndc1 n=1 Tax=Plakobranchus ocellatus TaxID=259542 RepID=A0AAV4C0P8_9GAST|nr:nucleoporin ndc1 [Plakobranchus ocellatus]
MKRRFKGVNETARMPRTLGALFSLQVCFSVAVIVACLLMVTWVSLPHFSVSSDLESSQLAFATSLFKWSRLPLMVICLLAASVSSWSLSRLCGERFESLTRLDETDTYPKAIPINSIRGVLSLSLLWQTFLCVASLTFAWAMATTIIRVSHTEPLEFPVVSDLDFEKDKTLPQALACSYGPLLQHLAMLDLHTLALYSQERRLQLLSLSQPGGHPRTWAAVSGETLAVIRELSEKLMAENWSIMSKVFVTPHMNGEGPSNERVNGSDALYRGKVIQHSVPGTTTDHAEIQTQNKMSGILKSLPFLSQVFEESPEHNSRLLFSSCQLQIWAVEALSEIAAKAYTEDKYGVVQTVLPNIISVLLHLHEVLEKHLKLSSSFARKANNSDESPPDILLKQKLFASNKASIYRIINTYRYHLSDLRLGQEHLKKLQPFTEYLV